MSSPRFRPYLRRVFEEAFSEGKLTVVDEIFATDCRAHIVLNGVPAGAQGFKWMVAMFRTAFPDLHCIVEDEISDGNKLAAHWIMRGTQRGMFLGNSPTDLRVEIHGMIFARLENGRIVEDWTLIDQMGALQQLGLIPPFSARKGR